MGLRADGVGKMFPRLYCVGSNDEWLDGFTRLKFRVLNPETVTSTGLTELVPRDFCISVRNQLE